MRANSFKALGVFLCYPEEGWRTNASELCDLLDRESLTSTQDRTSLRDFAVTLNHGDLFDLQEAYVDTFDRVRSLSLHLFEHVHGESRDRGQAMVDLAERYQEQGFKLAASELPDYLPVFLEYLSMLPKAEALEELAETGHILAAIGKRLAERGSPYAAVFDALTRLAGRQPEPVTRQDIPSPSFEQIDREWEEKAIDFLAAEAPSGGGCSKGTCGGECSSGGASAKMTQGACV